MHLPPCLPASILPVIVAEIRVQGVQIKSRGRSGAHQLRDHLPPPPPESEDRPGDQTWPDSVLSSLSLIAALTL